MNDPLTIQDYRNFLADKLRLISELAVAICGSDDPENPASIGFLIDTVDCQTRARETTQAENDRLWKALENISVAHIETETEFSQTIKNYSRAMIDGGRIAVADTPENRANPILGYPPLDLSPAFN